MRTPHDMLKICFASPECAREHGFGDEHDEAVDLPGVHLRLEKN